MTAKGFLPILKVKQCKGGVACEHTVYRRYGSGLHSRPVAAEFSFYMAVPVMAGASLLRLIDSGFGFTAMEWTYLGVGALVAFVVSLLVIRSLMSYVRKHDFSAFGVYRIILAVVVVLYFSLA